MKRLLFSLLMIVAAGIATWTINCSLSIPSSNQDRYCDRCGGDGKIDVECGSCRGYGEKYCQYCGGYGQRNCGYCSGSGELRCNRCGGTGLNRDRTDYCSTCGGYRVVRCQNCSGSGKVDCGSCDRGIVRCSSCNGKGYLKWSCPDCRGTGIIRSR